MGSSNSLFGKALGVFSGSAAVPKPLKGTVLDPGYMNKKTLGQLTPAEVAAPAVPDAVAMPDPLQQQQAKRRSLIEQLSRSGRSSTVLTNQGGTKLGG